MTAQQCRAVLVVAENMASVKHHCVRERGHRYSDFASNPKKLHRTSSDVLFHGGINIPASVHKQALSPEHYSEADRQTWMRT